MAAPDVERARRTGPARAAPVPPRRRPPRDDRADVGRAPRDGRRRDPRCPPRGRLLALPARSGRSLPDARGDERPRPLPDRPGPGAVRRGRHRPRRRDAQSRSSIPDVRSDPRFLWVRGIDQKRFVASMLSVPLSWNDQVVGVLNVQTEQRAAVQPGRRRPAPGDRRPARRDRREGPPADRGRGAARAAPPDRRGPLRADRARHPRAADAARGRPGLHGAPRRRSAARRAASRATRTGAPSARPGTTRRWTRSSGSTASSTRSSPRSGSSRRRPATVTPTDVEAAIDEVVDSIGPIVRQHHLDVQPGLGHHALADAPRLRQILEHLIENAVKYAPPETTITIDHALVEGSSGSASPTRARASPRSGASGSSSRTPGARPTRRAAPGSGCTPRSGSANRWARGCGSSRPSRPAPASSSPCPAAAAV